MGLKSNLRSEEILEQLHHAVEYLAAAGEAPSSLRNVVFMGMGEPLDNYGAVMDSLRGMTVSVF